MWVIFTRNAFIFMYFKYIWIPSMLLFIRDFFFVFSFLLYAKEYHNFSRNYSYDNWIAIIQCKIPCLHVLFNVNWIATNDKLHGIFLLCYSEHTFEYNELFNRHQNQFMNILFDFIANIRQFSKSCSDKYFLRREDHFCQWCWWWLINCVSIKINCKISIICD